MDLQSIESITRKAKSIFINPQVATYAGIAITTTMLAYYTLFSNGESSKTEEKKETSEKEPEEEKEEEPEEQKEEPVEKEEPEEPKEEPVEKEEPVASLFGGKRKKKSRMNKKKDKKNKSKRKQSK